LIFSGIGGTADGFQLLGDRFTVLPRAKIQGIADQMQNIQIA
jgi:hypothetical protein